MFNIRYSLAGRRPNHVARRARLLGVSVALLLGCNDNNPSTPSETTEPPAGPFRSREVAANAPSSFTQPRAGVPLEDGSVAFIATLEDRGTCRQFFRVDLIRRAWRHGPRIIVTASPPVKAVSSLNLCFPRT